MKNNIYKENYELQQREKQYQKMIQDCLALFYNIGGPLNDNVFNYNKKQLMVFFKLADILKQNIRIGEDEE